MLIQDYIWFHIFIIDLNLQKIYNKKNQVLNIEKKEKKPKKETSKNISTKEFEFVEMSKHI